MWWRRRNRESDLERELRSDLELEAAEQEAKGLPAGDARHAAARAFGNVTLIKEEVREMWGWASLEQSLLDVRYAARMLRRSPGFTAVAVISLALGVGANTAVFSILDAVLLKSLPVRDADALRIVTWVRKGDSPPLKSHSGYSIYDQRGRAVDGSFSYPAYQVFRTQLPQFSDTVAWAQNQFTVTAQGGSDLAFGHYVSGNYFTGLGAQTQIGRPILPDDDTAARPPVAVLAYQYWVRRFGSDPGVVNSVIQVNRVPMTVVGVMAPSFQGLQPGRAIDVFIPMAMVPRTAPPFYSLTAPDMWWVQVFARLKPGVGEPAAEVAIRQVFARHLAEYSGLGGDKLIVPEIVLEPGGRGVAVLRSSIGNAIYLLGGVAGIVLLIACANLANLLLARYGARAKEVAIRVSIGASRGRLLRQMLLESFVLAGAGAIAGLALARPLLRAMVNLFSGTATLGIDTRLDGRTLAFTAAVSIVTGLLFGTVPAWRASRVNPGGALKEGFVPSGRGSRMLLGRGLVSFQVALSALLLIGTGLFLRTLLNLAAVDLGFEAGNLLTFQTDPERSGYEAAQAGQIYRRVEARLTAIPGVEGVAVSQLPLIGGVATNGGVRLPGSDVDHPTWFLYCSDSFLSTLRIPVIRGRDLNAADFDGPARSAVVNETFVRKYLGNRETIGTVYYPPKWDPNGPDPQPITIVGVARDAHYRGVRDAVPPTAYVPFALRPKGDSRMVFVVRTRLVPRIMARTIRTAVASVDSNLPVAEMRTEEEQIARSIGTERLFATLVTSFGGIAVVLAGVGLYGIVAYSVSRRTFEIGVRLAMGARGADVQWLVLRQSLIMAGLGIAVGVPIALEMSTVASKLLYGVEPRDPVSVLGAVALMIVVAGLAAWIPARRAARVDPILALRIN